MTVAERRKREREERRSLILDAAEKTFHAKGFELTTMDDVAGEASLGKGTLYLYFQNKEDLLLRVALRRQQTALQRYAEASADATNGYDELRGLLWAYTEQMMSPPEHFRLMLSCWVSGPRIDPDLPNAAEHRQHIRRAIAMVCNAIERGRNDGSIRPGRAPERVAMQLWSALNGALLLRLQLAGLPPESPMTQHAPGLEEALDACLEPVRGPSLRDDEAATVLRPRRPKQHDRAGEKQL